MIRPRQLPTTANGITEFDPFAAPGPQAAAPDDSPLQLLHKFHRLLRGRYLLAFVLAALGAAGGAIGGFLATAPKWQSNGSIRIEPMRQIILERTPENSEMPYFDSFVQDQIISLEDQQTLDRAMMSQAWLKFDRGLDTRAKRAFRESLSVFVERNSRKSIKVRFVDVDKDAARVAVQQVIDSYKVLFGPRILLSNDVVVRVLKQERDRYELDLKTMNSRIGELGRLYGTSDLVTIHQSTLDKLSQAEDEFNALDSRIGQAEAAAKATPQAPEAPEKPALVLEWQQGAFEVARVDQTMSNLIAQREAARTDKLRLEQNYPPASRPVQRVVELLTALDTQIEQRYKDWMGAHGNMLPAAGAGAGPAFAVESLEVLRAKRTHAEGMVKKWKDEAIVINETRREIEDVLGQMSAKRKEQEAVEDRLKLLRLDNQQPTNTTAIGRVEILSDGEEATFYSDGRKKLAALGFLLGGSLPVFGVMLLGALDRRFRYSEDAQSGAARVPLLGILPYLPDSLTDPDQAGIAAHCVHQIRTLLQIGGVEHDRKVFAITSATSGDGKTSLCLSLGLSFAASGSTTCLIDFDLIGGGLTAAMGARTDVGLLAAIDDGQLDGHIRPTAFPRLSLIPAGRHDAQEISRLSPKLVRRLIDQARKDFDVVLIDTGPILGSIEATLVCGTADGVVLALGRGQQRSMATRALDTLGSVGAHIMGVVFNRAEHSDFKRTVSQSVRSVPVHDSGSASAIKALPAMGPVARTVVSHIRSDT